jgi:pSer/pThr/pTyr-binding forkhead associated (FHA) protein
MTEAAPLSVKTQRASAARVAKWLVEKGRPDEAVTLLAVWASSGPNDTEGQELLAEALRIDPAARVAQQAFELMEGVSGDHRELEEGKLRFGAEELGKLEAEMRRPSFRRAQMGFNNNIRTGDAVYHVQTEDSGLDQPHVITHLFADGGRVIKSHKRAYAEHVARADVGEYVRKLMKAQHLEMVLALREGRFDDVIAGRAVGGMEVLTEPPKVENIRKLASHKQARAEASSASISVRPEEPGHTAKPAPAQAVKFSLQVLRSLTGGPERYAPANAEAVIGSAGDVNLPGERFCHPREAKISFREQRLWLEDLEGGNGVFLRIRTPVELEFGDEFVIGDQLLRVERNPIADDGPDPDPTYFYSSPKWPSSFRIVQIFEGGALGCAVVARGNTLQVGSAIGDLIFPDDPLMAEQHCVIEEQAGTVMLTDLATRTGVFVRIRGEQEVAHGDEILVGRTRLVVELG